MNYIDLDGKLVEQSYAYDGLLRFLYTTPIGRMLLKPVVTPGFSRFAGKLLDTKLSLKIVPFFIKNAHIDMSDYPDREYDSFNDFFTRKVSEGKRQIDADEDTIISPCDCMACIYPIHDNTNFIIKHTEYTLKSLLRSQKLADRFKGGYIYLLRLTVSDYHRYVYAATGKQTKNYRIEGSFHTVDPLANDYLPIYKENTREYTLLHTERFGDVLQMEVGALLVGRIKNYKEKCPVKRGEEKGYFEYGGSTIVVITEKGAVTPRSDILENTAKDLETKVLQGQMLAKL